MSSRLAGSLADRLRSTLFRRGRIPGLRTAKVTLAVVAAYLLAEVLHLSEHPIVAPLVALLVIDRWAPPGSQRLVVRFDSTSRGIVCHLSGTAR